MKKCKKITMYITIEYKNKGVKVSGHVRGNQDRHIILKPDMTKQVDELTADICYDIESKLNR